MDLEINFGMWKLVVMEYFNGKPLYDGNSNNDTYVPGKVLKAIEVMHLARYVLGNVRPPNVMIGKEDQVMLVDLNCGGKEGEAWYPAYM
jgi:RIO-like serine/threonine protein kinase